jgi:hypothetical protein
MTNFVYESNYYLSLSLLLFIIFFCSFFALETIKIAYQFKNAINLNIKRESLFTLYISIQTYLHAIIIHTNNSSTPHDHDHKYISTNSSTTNSNIMLTSLSSTLHHLCNISNINNNYDNINDDYDISMNSIRNHNKKSKGGSSSSSSDSNNIKVMMNIMEEPTIVKYIDWLIKEWKHEVDDLSRHVMKLTLDYIMKLIA